MNAISPSHYQQHPSGVECISVARDQTFCIGSALKYLWRAGLKGSRLEDLQKARQYLVWAKGSGDRPVRTAAADRFIRWHVDHAGRTEDLIIVWILCGLRTAVLAELDDLIEDGDD